MVNNFKKIIILLLSIFIIFMIYSIREKEYKYKIIDQDLYRNNKIIISKVVDFKIDQFYNGKNYLLTIESKDKNQRDLNVVYGNFLKIYEINNDDLKLIYKNDFTKVKPWEIDTGIIDDDGMMDIYLGAITETEYYPKEKRPFFFNWNGEYLTRKWTGSYIGLKPLISIELIDFDNDGIDEIKKKEELENGEYNYSLFEWGNFGFYIIE
ncbi:MAG: hypothetical protein ACQEQE_05785 [Bacillota bacterium]